MIRRILFLLLLVSGLAYAQSVPPNGCTTTTCTGTVLPGGFLMVSGNQIQDGVGNNVRLACTEYRGGASGAQAVMNAIAAAGFNCVRIGYRDKNITTPPTPADCSATAAMAACVTAAANATAGGNAWPLKVIIAHYGNETPAAGSPCLRQQANGLPYDLNGAAPYNILAANNDGCGNAGTITYATFKQNWVNYATQFAGNPTVIGFDLHNEPLTYGNGTNSASWGTGGGSPTPPPTDGPGTGPAFQALTGVAGVDYLDMTNGQRLSIGATSNGTGIVPSGFNEIQVKPYEINGFWRGTATGNYIGPITAAFVAEGTYLWTPQAGPIYSATGCPPVDPTDVSVSGIRRHVRWITAGSLAGPVSWGLYYEPGFDQAGGEVYAVINDFSVARGDTFHVTANMNGRGVITTTSWGSILDFSAEIGGNAYGLGWVAFLGHTITRAEIINDW